MATPALWLVLWNVSYHDDDNANRCRCPTKTHSIRPIGAPLMRNLLSTPGGSRCTSWIKQKHSQRFLVRQDACFGMSWAHIHLILRVYSGALQVWTILMCILSDIDKQGSTSDHSQELLYNLYDVVSILNICKHPFPLRVEFIHHLSWFIIKLTMINQS